MPSTILFITLEAMNFRILFSVLLLLSSQKSFAQYEDTGKYEYRILNLETFYFFGNSKTAAGNNSSINQKQISNFSKQSIVQSLNTVPGVRMEERSPGSYRLSLRGSSLRAPFGVRNVKVYYNDIPITDPGGITYLNALGTYNFGKMEVIKGPASSLYGAGNGGVINISSSNAKDTNVISTEIAIGGFGYQQVLAALNVNSKDKSVKIKFQEVRTLGYRNQSASQHKIGSFESSLYISGKTTLNFSAIGSYLKYQTPGGLTRAEYTASPTLARPTIGNTPGAIAKHAEVFQSSIILGSNLYHVFSEKLWTKATLYGLYNKLENPNIRNYSQSLEPHAGGRWVGHYNTEEGNVKLNLDGGLEYQQGFSTFTISKNNAGQADTLKSVDDISNRSALAFLQGGIEYNGYKLEGGASLSNLKTEIRHRYPSPVANYTRDYGAIFSPRLALRKSLSYSSSVYVSLSRGFSPPGSSEVQPSGSPLNTSLRSERGTSYEAGYHSYLFSPRLQIHAAIYHYTLSNAIVQRRDSLGGSFFINSGGTRQQGLEVSTQWQVLTKLQRKISLDISTSLAIQRYRYKNFIQNNDDYSGNILPGTPPVTFFASANLEYKKSLQLAATWLYNDIVQLNDANTAAAASFHNIGLKATWQFRTSSKTLVHLFAGHDNLLNQRYTSAPDVNAFGGRYYNAAPTRNYFAGVGFGGW